MIRIGRKIHLLLVVTMTLLTVSCSQEEDQIKDLQAQIDKTKKYMIYDGEWTINKQVVDTARLEVINGQVLRVRLPEVYLEISCFEKEHVSSAKPFSIAHKGLPAIINLQNQGYSEKAEFNSITAAEISDQGTTFFSNLSFYVTIDDVDHQVDLLSDEPGNAIYRNDNGQWTIGFTVNAFRVTNQNTLEMQMRTPLKPITLYYNTKERIR